MNESVRLSVCLSDVLPCRGTSPFQNLNEEGCVMISLAQRVRDFRYSKGWGPDELASRAEISRTALYQIESGKTGLPRAGTLRRIAVALEVPMEDLLGNEGDPHAGAAVGEPGQPGRALKTHFGWVAAE